MPKPIKWANQMYAIRERVANSKTETWSRHDIEWAFDIKRVAAQDLMKKIGGTTTIASQRFVSRTDVLGFLDEMIKADDLRDAMDARQIENGPEPLRRRIHFPIPEDAKGCTMMRLPDGIELSPLKIVITGSTSEELLTNLYLLGTAFLNDPLSMQASIEPLPKRREPMTAGEDEWQQALIAI
jgi:hypothetical protein